MDVLRKSAGWGLLGIAGVVWLLCLLPATQPPPDFSLPFLVGTMAFLFGCAMAFPRPGELVDARHECQVRRWNNGLVCVFLIPMGVLCLMTLTHQSRPPPRSSQCKSNLKQIGLALHEYHSKYGCFPPAYIADAEGRPMHSWRVLILPFLDQLPLYKQYRFDEPWNGPNNQRLTDKALAIYTCPSDDQTEKNGRSRFTSYVAIVGPETAWPGGKSVADRDISDGFANTLLVVEVANSRIPWAEPRDLQIRQMAPTINSKSGQGISSRHGNGANVLIADGSAENLQAWVTAHAGDKQDDF